MRHAAILARLFGAEIEAAKLKKLADVPEATEVTRLRQNEQGEDGSNARHGLQTVEVRVAGHAGDDLLLEGLPTSTELLILLEHDPKHANGGPVFPGRQGDAMARGV